MSKKCCGMTYSNDETVCKVCGKNLSDSSRDLNDIPEDIEDIEDAGDIKEGKLQKESDSEITEVLTKHNNEKNNEDADTQITEVLNYNGYTAMNDDADTTLGELPEEERNNDAGNKAENEVDEADDEAENEADDEAEDEADDEASAGLKFVGILSILAAIAGLAFIGIGFYFLIISPLYDKRDEVSSLNYPYIASTTDSVATPGEGGWQ